MLTIFSIPKAFVGHIGVIQRNALKSWSLLEPRCEIIIFGDEEDIAEAAAETGAAHVPEIGRNEPARLGSTGPSAELRIWRAVPAPAR